MQTKIKLIGMVGRAGAGKTTVANHLVKQYGFTKWSFASPLKEMLIKAGMITHEEAYIEKTAQSRWLLQKIGTDIFRKQVDELFWVNKMRESIEDAWDNVNINIVLDDIRFPEEAQMVRDLGGTLIMVERGDYVDATAGITHESESKVQQIECDHEMFAHSGDTGHLFYCMDEIMKAEV